MAGDSFFTCLKGVAEEALRQSVQDAMVSTEHLPALTPKLRVFITPPLSVPLNTSNLFLSKKPAIL